MRALPLALGATLAGSLAGVVLPATSHGTTRPATGSAAAPSAVEAVQPAARSAQRRAVPTLDVRRVATGLDHPWDVHWLGNGRLIFTERDRATLSILDGDQVRRLDFPSSQVWVSGETGLMSVEVDPNFGDNRRVYTCQGGTRAGGRHDVRVVAWRLNRALTRARQAEVLLSGLPASSGRHGGCALEILRDGSLLVGTGDAAVGTNPRDLSSLGGKTLRLDRWSGAPWRGNPFRGADDRDKRFVWTYGHRNVQGLAQRRDGSLWSVEQGTYRDDEVNRLVKGGDYGWHPVPGYDESVPMTDHDLPGRQVGARWSSGDPTLATSGATFVHGKAWDGLDGALAVTALKASRVLFLVFDKSGDLLRVRVPEELRELGRLRGVAQAPGGALYLTTDNGEGRDAIVRVVPR